ncbi:integral membrane sensor signal transduction histidine kinase [Citrifermentans bremense]|uniref:histidine kinase n=1 Tax=Citrifermentans bremense TaxID=60035 RepID=A0A6S6M510_9BACT|nr:ATP-binding protein [Citrifermentans bremense]BCG46764.1 integral membrane sensor signal transduction histidine kinase [Citrifermentans bremense]
MHTRLKFPLRFKMLLSQLLVVSVVLSLITFTMANLFQVDKTAYIHDLTSTVVLHTAEEANALLSGYRERLKLFSRVLAEPELSGRDQVLQGFFEEFRDFVLVTRSAPGGEQTVYDQAALQAAGVTKEEILSYRQSHPAPESIPAGQVYLENSTLSAKLPTLNLTISEPGAGGGAPVTTTAVLRLDRLQELAKRSRVFDILLLDSAGRYLAHRNPDRVGVAVNPEWWQRVKAPHSSGMTMEYKKRGREMVGGFSRCALGGLVVGVEIPKSAAYLTSRELLSDLLLLSLALLGGAALLSQFWSRRFTRPLEKLSAATRMVGQGRFEIEVKPDSGDEIGALASSFNQMAAELKLREKALKDLYGQLVHSEKMAAFGALGAGIAHEVKNPLAGILGITQLSLRGGGAGHPLEKNLLIIEKETKRCKTIIENLLKFARQEQVEFGEVDIQQVVADALAIVDHQLGINSIKVEQELEPGIPACRGNANQLQQVLMNLMINAQQAMSGKTGTVKLSARKLDQGGVELRVADNGPGISKEIQGKIFDPFFTTKPAGQGTGLGLSVTYGIVKDHGGEIHLESEEGVGTTFIITLPPSAAGTP